MAGLICFLLALPFLAVLGHDVYIAYGRAEEDYMMILETFQWSDLGWLWVQYAPDSYDWVKASLNPAVWEGVVGPLLEQTAALVFAVPALVVYVYLIVAKLVGLWPYNGDAALARKSKGNYAFDRTDKPKGSFKYKRH
ncbi:MAG: hypothetical protein H6868_01765 [Rhodospirillales bacterium]|nr:hypothetical protein [Rhodospirillales bacterium]